MNNFLQVGLYVALIGVGATAVLDVWALFLNQLKVPMLNFAMIGRWVGYVARGKWFHLSIQKAEQIKAEAFIGWFFHYAIGMLFSVGLVLLFGKKWIIHPTFVPAVIVGLVSAAAPLFIMQPAMGAGVLSHRTARPMFNVIKTLVNHLVFGCGLFLIGFVLSRLLLV